MKKTAGRIIVLLFVTIHSNGQKPRPADVSPHESKFVTANGVRLNYLDWGGSGEPILFITGMGDTGHIYDGLTPAITDKFRVIVLTRRGYGDSEKPLKGYDADTLTEDVRAVLDQLKIDRVNLIGHSAAGNELTNFAAKYPKRTLRLVYLDAAYDRHEVPGLEDKDPLLPPAPQKKPGEVLPENEKIEAEFFRQMCAFNPPYRRIRAPVLSYYAIFEKHWEVRPDTPAEKQKSADEFISKHVRPYQRRQIERLRRELPNARIVELTGTNHYFFRDKTKKDEVVATIRDFLLTVAVK